MADFGRYDDETRTRGYDRDRNSNRSFGDRSRGDSMFDFGGDRDRDRSSFGRREERSGWGGIGRDDDDYRSRSGRGRERGYGDRDNDRHFGSDDYREGLPVDETSRLIASNKVEGTSVYGSGGDKLGSIYNFMVDKRSGKVEYAVMRYGGFLGMGERYYPLPWRILTYDKRVGGYHIEMRERDLESAPSFDRNSEPRFNDHYGDSVDRWYGVR